MKLFTIAAAALAISAVSPAVAQRTVTTTSRTTHTVTNARPTRWHYKQVCHSVRRGHHVTRVCTRQRVRW